MNVLESSVLFQIFDGTVDVEEEIQAIKDLIKKSSPSSNRKFSLKKIEEEAGWIRITAQTDKSKFLIKHSSYVSDTSVLIQFLTKIIDTKEDIVLFLDYEGSNPMLYVSPVNENDVRFLFAHDYNLFLNNDIDEYTTKDYTIECDVIVNKKELLKDFYNILYPFTINYNIKEAQKGHYDDVFKIDNAKIYLNKIKSYLNT